MLSALLSLPRVQEVTGQVFAYDKNTNCVIIKSVGSHGGVSNLRFLKTNYIKVRPDAARWRAAVQHGAAAS